MIPGPPPLTTLNPASDRAREISSASSGRAENTYRGTYAGKTLEAFDKLRHDLEYFPGFPGQHGVVNGQHAGVHVLDFLGHGTGL
jgi:hypothetical protein